MAHFCKVAKELLACACALATAVVHLPVTAYAQDTVGDVFVQDGITYKVTAAGEVQVGNGAADLAVDHAATGTDVVIPQTVSHGDTEYTVTAIGTRSFQNDKKITSVTLPSSIKSIGTYAFDGCGTMDDSGEVPVYTGLEQVFFSGTPGLKYIYDYAFRDCYNLEAFTIPASVTGIENYAFNDCMSFDRLEFEEGTTIQYIGICAFEISWQSGFVKPKGWTESDGWDGMGTSFVSGENSECYVDIDFTQANEDSKVYGGLKYIVIPKSIQFIKMRAFANQRVLKHIIFQGESIEYFDSYVFAFCTSLTQVELPDVGHIMSADEGYITGLGNHLFTCCTNLETFIFNDVRSPSGRWNSLRMFDGCRKLTKVIYNHNKIIPAKGWDFGFNTQQFGFQTNDPTLYYRVGFSNSKEQAQAGSSELGWAVLREGTSSSEVKDDMAASDAEGTVIFRGVVPDLPDGYDAWAFVTRGGCAALASKDGIDDVVFAYPVNSKDLGFGDIELSSSAYWYDGQAHTPNVTVVDAAGNELASNAYQLSWQRMAEDGTWSSTTDMTSQGALRAVATGTGVYSGTVTRQFSINYLEKGVTFEQGGITYMVSRGQTSSSSAELQVGDGESLAVNISTSGTLSIPQAIQLEGSTVQIPVTGIAARAFGSDDAEDACGDITGIELPSSLETIGELAFSNMSSLSSIELPASLRSIGTGAFKCCSSLASIQFSGNTIERIGSDAFAYCSRLRSVELPAVTGSFLGLVFQNCVMLSSVTFDGTVNGSRLSQFQGCDRLSSVEYRGDYWDYPWSAGTAVKAVAGTGVSKAAYTYTAGSAKAVYASCGASGKKATVPAKVAIGSTTYSVTGIAANAFIGSKATQLTVASVSLSKASAKGCLKGSKVTVVKVPTKKKSAYKKVFSLSNCGKKVTVK